MGGTVLTYVQTTKPPATKDSPGRDLLGAPASSRLNFVHFVGSPPLRPLGMRRDISTISTTAADSDGHSASRSDWETLSATSNSATTPTLDSPLAFHPHSQTEVADRIYSLPRRQHTPPPALQAYWKERARFIKHLEKRADKFAKRSKEEYDAARWGIQPKKKNTKGPAKRLDTAPAPATPVPPNPSAESPTTPLSDTEDMIASTSSKGALRAASVRRKAFHTLTPGVAIRQAARCLLLHLRPGAQVRREQTRPDRHGHPRSHSRAPCECDNNEFVTTAKARLSKSPSQARRTRSTSSSRWVNTTKRLQSEAVCLCHMTRVGKPM